MDISRYWKNIVDSLQDGIMVVDTGGIIRAVNPSVEKLTGYPKDELLGQSCRILNCTGCKIIGKGRGPDFCKLFTVGESKLKNCTITNKDNHAVYILKKGVVITDDRGKMIGAVEVLTDMTVLRRKQEEIDTLKKILHFENGFYGILGKTPVMETMFHLIRQVSDSDAPVLIQGESGTGKEMVALAVHENSPRKGQPFIKVNCAALNENLFESELFGHVKGAFTGADKNRVGRFEAANSGSIFLDEIGDIPLSTQVKLLRVLEEKEVERVGEHAPFPVDIRIISATNRNLEQMVRQGLFRKDLFFRINVFPLSCPPLNRRKEDIPLIINEFIRQNNEKSNKPILGVSAGAMELLAAYNWPGNVRELRNAIEYACVLCPGGWIGAEHLPPSFRIENICQSLDSESPAPEGAGERAALIAQLRQTRGNQSELARRLGISRVTLWKRVKKYGIRIPEDI
ncbi:MAG: sigma 54-interacting transcriptional regulator [Desulfobacter sp.]|nr:MAG: sigma 54-interacting transcriptional regulator [Desulfobacter sp.]